ncbi:hypothetical protein DIS24_g3030 [Lasiodiplodia hormozganensis]|uniref:Uncharacterized protein n=1 Tax=Lasiodiplodia hormozganensis TaxID=869390 RepID=A0AA39YZL3_9PEZI|nr:hypothetical protein DIS24_g3030 [Lasiodiplodia hormozganensis]
MPRKKGKGKSKASASKKHKATEGNDSAAQTPEHTTPGPSTGGLPAPSPKPGPHSRDDSSHAAPENDASSDRSTITADDSTVFVDEQGDEIKRYVTVTDDIDGQLLAIVLPNNELRIVIDVDDEHPGDTIFRTRRAEAYEDITVDERPPFRMGIVGRGPDEYAHAESYATGVLECFADAPDPPKTRNTSGANADQWDEHIMYLTGAITVINAEDPETGHVFSRGLAGPNVDEIKEKILAKSKIWRPDSVIYNSALNEGADNVSIERLVAAIDKFISNTVSEPVDFDNHILDDSEAAFADIATMEFCECCPKSSRSQENNDKGASDHETAVAVPITSTKVSEVEIPHQSHHWVKWVQSYRTPREPPFKVQGISEMSFTEEGENTNALEDEVQEEKKEAVKKKKKKKSKKKKKAVEEGTEGSIPPPTEPSREESEKVSEDHSPPATEPPLEEFEKVTEIFTPPATELPAEQSEKGTKASTPPPTEPPTDVFEKEDGGSDSLQPPEEQITDFKVPAGSNDAANTDDQPQWLAQNKKRGKRNKRGGKYPTPTGNSSPQWRGGSRKRFRGQKSKLSQEVEQLKQSNGEGTVSPPAPIEPPGSGESTLPPSLGVQYDTIWPSLESSSTFASSQSKPTSLPDSGFASDNAKLEKVAHQKEPEKTKPEPSGADKKLDFEHQDANTAVIDSGSLENQDTKNINGADGISVQEEENTSKEKVSLRVMKARDVRSISGYNPKAGGLRRVYYFSKDARDFSKEKPPAMTEPARKCKINFLATDDTDSSLCAYNPITVPLAITIYTPVDIPPVPPTGGSDEAQASLNRDISGKLQPWMTEHESLKVRVEHLETMTSNLMNNNTTLSYNTSTLPQKLQATDASFTPSYTATSAPLPANTAPDTSFIPQYTAPNTPSMPQYTATGAPLPTDAASNVPFMNQYTGPNAPSMNQYPAAGAPFMNQYPAAGAPFMNQYPYPNAPFINQYTYPNASSMNQYPAAGATFMNQYTDPNASSMNQYTATGAPFMNQYTATGAPFMNQYPATGTPFIPANTATGSYHTGGQGYQYSHHTHGHGNWLPPHPHTQPPAPIASADTATNSATVPEDSATIPEDFATIPEDVACDSATRPRNTASTQAQTLRKTKSF